VNKTELTRHFDVYRQAGMGGVHIVPIYGAKGYEEQYIDYLSPPWMEMLAHCVAEAKRVGMGVDMTTGTGWPFGGPHVTAKDANAYVVLQNFTLVGGKRLNEEFRKDTLQALMAYSSDGRVVRLTDKVTADGQLNWTAPPGTWTLYAISQSAKEGRKVKRAAPGGAGYCVNPFSRRSLKNYLAPFDKALTGYRGGPPRAFYHDSYEYRGNWADDLFSEFKARRGYELQAHLPALFGGGPADTATRVRCDYRETVADMMLENFIMPWVKWAHAKGAVTRNQAHGSPGNILDLYAAADIPETEAYGTGWIQLSGLDLPPGLPETYGGAPDLLANKMASSAAHVSGRRLVGCESCTWLSERFQATLAQVKAQVDLLFTLGVNHVIYHGMAYSPREAGWPGWLYYASTNFAPSNSFWRNLPELNAYIARCQSFLQAGRADNDVLVYLPIYDLWSQERGSTHMLQHMQVHNSGVWLQQNLAAFNLASQVMWDRGYGLDFVSDRQLDEKVSVAGNVLKASGSAYRALVVAGCTLMPPETLARIAQLARDGATVIVVGGLPQDVPGLSDLQRRRKRFRQTLAAIGEGGKLGKGRLLIGDDLQTLLQQADVRREVVVDEGIEFIRRATDTGWTYFFANPGKKRLDGWVPLAVPARSAVIFDPLRQRRGLASLRHGKAPAMAEVYLQLDPGESLVLRALTNKLDAPSWTYLQPFGEPRSITGTWKVTFVEGGPQLPGKFQTQKLASWTELGDSSAKTFSGTARYRITFTEPTDQADEWLLDLGTVRDSARVTLNGKPLGTLFARPFRVRLGAALRDGANQLEVEVTNSMANRMIGLDRSGKLWHEYHNSFPFMTRRPPRQWQSLPSGLLGPVQLAPVRLIPMQATTGGGA